jgi:gamma-glutamylcyclotransferase (GGCT)/AIG2-like uncharacterized protein YtfP
MPSPKTDYIFVYGTLRSDAKNEMYKLLARHARFVSDASFTGKLFQVSYYPGAVCSDTPSDQVFGEVYELLEPELVLARLDDYEECGPGFSKPTEYVREQHWVTLADQKQLCSWIYIYNRPTEALVHIHCGDFLKHISSTTTGTPHAKT